MTSTALDATLFLLLVGAGVATVVTAPDHRPTPETGVTDATATTLATSTATVNYSLRGADAASDPHRTEHGTLATLLAAAAMARVEVDGRRTTRARDDLVTGVRNAVRAAVGTARTQVVAVWRPYPGAPVGGRVTVGSAPPPRADVRAARLAVARTAGNGTVSPRAGDRGYRPLAAAVAERTVSVLFPRRASGVTLRSDDPENALVRRRYRTVGDAVGADLDDRLAAGDAAVANRKLVAAFRRRFERDLEREFDSPRAAARATRTGEVRVVVRRWDP